MDHTLSAIKRIENRAKQIPGVISLAQGIPSLPSHHLIRNEVIDAMLNNKVDKYSPPAGLLEMRTFISQKLAEKNMEYSHEHEIIVTAGGIEALSATMLALLKHGDEVIILTPAYPNYERIILMAGGKPIMVPLSEKGGWILDLSLLKKRISRRTKAIILCSPNNPTGSVLSEKQLRTIGILAQRHKFLVICDDIYEHFYFGDNAPFNLCTQNQFKKQIIRIVSFSKDFSLSGWRIGFIHADNEHISKILSIHDNLINCAPVISQYAGLAALKNEKVILNEYMEIYRKRRKIMGDCLESLSEYVQFTWPNGAYYFFPKIIGATDVEGLCFDILEKAKVAVVPGDDFGAGGKGHIRLCFGKSEEEIIEGMKRLEQYFLYNKFTEV
ncbi:MAG: pyridoxal phosphate-dependent aminotransferase [bacterium]|nr:pyridoxal phosphate-dependent aminotransferase [bacterium]